MTQRQLRATDTQPTVLLAHRHALLREGIACILGHCGFSVVGESDTVRDLSQLVVQHKPDVVMLDWELPDRAEDAIREIVGESPNSAVVILTRPQPQEDFGAAMRSGISGYLSVNLSTEEFVNALRMLVKGNVIVSPDMAEQLQDELTTEHYEQPLDVLSDRERAVLDLVAHGASNKEIAEALIITQNTVKVHLRNVLDKLNLRNRQQAAAFAAQEGLVGNVASEEPRN